MLNVLMLTRRSNRALVVVCLAVFSLAAPACEKVPLLAPSGSSITLTASTTALSANGTMTITAQVLEAAGTPPHSGTRITFTTTIGRIEPAEVNTDVGGRAKVTFIAGGSNGTATIAAVSGGATTGSDGALKIAVGTAAVAKVIVSASPQSVSAAGGASTITATVLDINGNALIGSPVLFTSTAGTLSTDVAVTNSNGAAVTVLTTSQQATVTASVGVQGSSGTGGTGSSGTGSSTTSGQASGTVTVNVRNAPSITVTAPTATIYKGVAARFTFTVTAASANGSAVREVKVNWGDGRTDILGTFTGSQTQDHIFTNDGTFIVTGTVTDGSGDFNTTSTTVSVLNPPKASVLVTPSAFSASAPATIAFTIAITGLPTGVALRSVSIDYGDGQSEELGATASASRSHVYTTGGGVSRKVVVTAVDTSGQVSEGSTTVVIN
jgi:hypothetical protein